MKYKVIIIIGFLLCLILAAIPACGSNSGKVNNLEAQVTSLTSELEQANAKLTEKVETAQDYVVFATEALHLATEVSQLYNKVFDYYLFDHNRAPSEEIAKEIYASMMQINAIESKLEYLYAPNEGTPIKTSIFEYIDKVTPQMGYVYVLFHGQNNSIPSNIVDVHSEIGDLYTANQRALIDLQLKYQHVVDKYQQ